jgi:hypothetical protein
MHPLRAAGRTPSRVQPAREPMLEVVMTLARRSKQQRIIIAGAKSAELMAELHRRGYHRAASTTTCGLPHGQYDAALIDWRQRSIKALATTLDWLVDFLTPTGVLVVWIDPQDSAGNRTVRTEHFPQRREAIGQPATNLSPVLS